MREIDIPAADILEQDDNFNFLPDNTETFQSWMTSIRVPILEAADDEVTLSSGR